MGCDITWGFGTCVVHLSQVYPGRAKNFGLMTNFGQKCDLVRAASWQLQGAASWQLRLQSGPWGIITPEIIRP
jgi:hypothetical protein